MLELPESQAGDTIRFQLFVPGGAGRQIGQYTVELALKGKSLRRYVDDVYGADFNGDTLLPWFTETGNRTLTMLPLSVVSIPASGYLGQVNLRVSRALTSLDSLAVQSASILIPGGDQNLDVTQAVLTFRQAPACTGDFNGDGMVNLADFLAFAGGFGARSGDASFDSGLDLDGSGSIDLSDFLAFAVVFGTTCPTPPSPEETANEGEDPSIEVLRSEKARKTSLSASDVKLDDLVRGNSAFAFNLYSTLRSLDGNLFYSPHSISVALAMMYAGAGGETARQMEEVLRFQLPADQLHPAFNVLDLALSSRGEDSGGDDGVEFRLNIANAIWGQKGYAFLPHFLDTLAENYGAGMRAVDFAENPEASRTAINDWVAKRTEDKIRDMFPQGTIDRLTRLVLTNAIYFKAAWHRPFDESLTSSEPFHLPGGNRVDVPMMHQTGTFNYALDETYEVQSVELLYAGEEASLIILLPARGEFEKLENALSADLVGEITKRLSPTGLRLSVPSFEIESDLGLAETLGGMGMADAFDPESADFSGIVDTKELFVSAVVHKAFVKVDEWGTEASAAAGATIGATSVPPAFTADRPFIFLIRDNATDAILFVGRVVDPR